LSLPFEPLSTRSARLVDRDSANDRPSLIIDVDVLDSDVLRSASAKASQCFGLHRVCRSSFAAADE
jgi:hypothetical protein